MTSNKYSDHDHLDRYGEDAYVRECQTMKQGIEEISTMAKEKWQKLSQKTRSLIAWALLATSIGGWVAYFTKSDSQDQKTIQTEQVFQEHKWEKLSTGLEVLRDGEMYFCKVKKWATLSWIRYALSKEAMFSYLSDDYYAPTAVWRNICSFNIRAQDLKADMYIPIPVPKEQREISLENFYKQTFEAIDEMVEDPIYGEKIRQVVDTIGKEKIAQAMTAFARSESTNAQSDPNAPIGQVELHRREPAKKQYSFSHYHILMDKIGKKARINLKLSEGQTYNPKNGSKLFLAYWVEKVKSLEAKNQKPLSYYFDIDSPEKAAKIWRLYNGDSIYGVKFRENIQLCANQFKS